MGTDALVTDYLTRLETAAEVLPPDRRAELLDEVRGHIQLALDEAPSHDEPAVRQVLVRLGTPEEIVAAEIDGDAGRTIATTDAGATIVDRPAAEALTPWHPHPTTETKALLVLSLGGVLLPFLGPLFGMWIAWSSDRWTRTQKRTALASVLGFLLLPAIVVLPILLAGEVTAVINDFGPVLVLIPLSGLVTAFYLWIVLRLDVVIVERHRS